jgi:hypothetical protein
MGINPEMDVYLVYEIYVLPYRASEMLSYGRTRLVHTVRAKILE